MNRIIGLDVGSVRIGVAVSDPLGMTAQPLKNLMRGSRDLGQQLRALFEHYESHDVVIGLPLQLNGEEGFAAQAIREFAQDELAKLDVEIHWMDERLSTAMAEKTLIADNVRRKKRKEKIDGMAAALILQSYLDSKCA